MAAERWKEGLYAVRYESPLGAVTIAGDGKALTHILFGAREEGFRPAGGMPLFEEAIRQMEEYFRGRRRDFDLPLVPAGTAFQQRVWAALRRIPYGETRTYGEVARMTGNEKACRAVGMANNRNPIPVIIPCHRVIGADGSLVGYSGGLDMKEKLLRLEGSAGSPKPCDSFRTGIT